jgi:hypothetical protein
MNVEKEEWIQRAERKKFPEGRILAETEGERQRG